MAEELNPFEIAKKQIDVAAKKLKVDAGLLEILKNPTRMLSVSLPVKMRNNKITVFTGYRCQYNDFRGPTKGAIHFQPDLTEDKIKALGCWMTWKCAVMNLPFGGASGGVICNPAELNAVEFESLVRRYAYALREYIGPEKDIPSSDANTDSQTIAWFMDTYSSLMGYNQLGVITGKPLGLGGSFGTQNAPGRGCAIAIRESAMALGLDLTKATAAIMGSGNIGAQVGENLEELGVTVIAMGDSGGGVYNPNGLKVKDVIKHVNARSNKNKSVKGFSGSKPLAKDKLIEIKCDILICASLENPITKTNAKKIKAKIIAEAVNGPTTPEADEILHKKSKIFLIPDILANAGGVTVSYFEWVQNVNKLLWTEEQVSEELERYMVCAFKDVYEISQKNKVDMRTAAYMLAIGRIAEAHQTRGLWP